MDNNAINNVFLKLQDLYFKKSSEEEINHFLSTKNISIDWLVQKFETLEIKDEYRLENILKIIDILTTYPTHKKNLFSSVINKQDIIINSKIPQMNKVITAYLFDDNAGIYEQARNVLLFILNSGKFDEKFIDTDLIFHYFETKKNNSILLVRGIELVTMMMSSNERFINNCTNSIIR